jgi:amidase
VGEVDLKNYIGGLLKVPTGVADLADLIAFNTAHADQELPAPFYTSQSM